MNDQNTNVPAGSQLPPAIAQDGVPAITPHQVPVSRNTQASHGPTTTANGMQPANSPHAPTIADDNDLIEKEWVNRAKLIIAKTKDDPREQSKQLHKYKADYIKKRYNKDIKVSEE